jgi:Protease inhibitor Inh
MPRVAAILVTSMLSLALSQRAPAQTLPAPSDAAKSMVGGWELSNAERDKTCVIAFRLDAAGPGRAFDVDKTCATVIPAVKDAVAWTRGKDDVLQFLDAKGKIVAAFDEVESGLFESARGTSDALYFLQAVAALEGQRTADQMFGNWAFARAGKPICQVTLMNEAATTDGFAIELKPGCDALITTFGPKLWRMDHGQLVVVSTRGETWRLEEADPTTWHRIPEGRQPLLLVKQ